MKNIPKRADSEASSTSNGRIIVIPMPTAAPFTAAINGFDSRHSFTQSRPAGMPPWPPAVLAPGSPPAIRTENVASMSAPAQNPRPSPVSTMAPTPGSRFADPNASASSSAIVGVHALSRSGRLSVTSCTSPRRSLRICS
jgi:hypothetical protein